MVKDSPADAVDMGDRGLIPGSGRSAGGGHGNAVQCSCLESPTDRGAWWATVHGVTLGQTGLSGYAQQSGSVSASEVAALTRRGWA